MNARLYDPSLGRFLSADTLIPNPYETQDFNRYAYVRNNPLKYTDPSGHCPAKSFKASALKQLLIAWNLKFNNTFSCIRGNNSFNIYDSYLIGRTSSVDPNGTINYNGQTTNILVYSSQLNNINFDDYDNPFQDDVDSSLVAMGMKQLKNFNDNVEGFNKAKDKYKKRNDALDIKRKDTNDKDWYKENHKNIYDYNEFLDSIKDNRPYTKT